MGSSNLASLIVPTSARGQFEAPHGPVEKAIAAIWSDLLDVEQVGRQADFFELGGHGTLAVQLVHRVRQVLEIDIAMRDLFQAPVLQSFAAAVSARIRLARFPHGATAARAGFTAVASPA